MDEIRKKLMWRWPLLFGGLNLIFWIGCYFYYGIFPTVSVFDEIIIPRWIDPLLVAFFLFIFFAFYKEELRYKKAIGVLWKLLAASLVFVACFWVPIGSFISLFVTAVIGVFIAFEMTEGKNPIPGLAILAVAGSFFGSLFGCLWMLGWALFGIVIGVFLYLFIESFKLLAKFSRGRDSKIKKWFFGLDVSDAGKESKE